MPGYKLSDLLDMSLIQTLADSNFRATGLPMSIIDNFDRSFLVRSGWTDLCMKFHRAHPASKELCREADASVQKHLVEGEAYQYKCRFGLWHVAMPIMVAGRHLATMFMTQYGIEGEVPETRFYINLAGKFGYDLDAYISALDRLPVFSREKVDYIIAYDKAMVRFISDLAEQSLQLKKSHEKLEERVRERTAELAKTTAFMEDIFDNTADAIGITDRRGHLTKWNKASSAMYGFSFEELQDKPVYDLYADKDELAQMLNELRREDFVKNYEINMKRKNGQIFPCSLSVKVLRSNDNQILGSVTVSRDLTESKKNLAKLESANTKLQSLVTEADKRNRQMALLKEVGDVLQVCWTAAETYEALAHFGPQFFPGYAGGLYLLNDAGLFDLMTSWGEASSLELVFGHDDCWGLRRSHTFLVNDPETAMNCPHLSSSLPAGYLCLPMMAQGKAMGILHLQRLSSEQAEPLETIEQYAHTVAEAMAMSLANLKLRETLHNQTIRDGLTGLFTRRHLEENLEKKLSRGQRLGTGAPTTGLALLDLDHFKEYNDSFGYSAGDELLKAVGRLIRGQTGPEDLPCRYGGEEFLLLMPGVAPEAVLERLKELVRGIRRLHQQSAAVNPATISAGVAIFPLHGDSGKDLIRAADAALYRAKAEGRDRVVMAGDDLDSIQPILANLAS